ncbi:CNNM domain-containing protein [Coxiella-like endosymbiont of Rhipicephalus sanguineus]|uniref:CNNM domain-containing protein n=1 Tax=Coxiella-like endosymbiont of Rhipicephalus sanguineus TaxID=1955402 RepID=UPI00203DD34A|nr:CNNM domain-containing protein [Coxiella-like endosymbiont of Rhipicephalus sanguineus]
MTHADVQYFSVLFFLLILISAFFDSETGMMAINHYRLRHLACKGNVKTQRVIQLLQRPDRLIGVILIGNTFANILDLVIPIVIAVHFLGNLGVIVATVILTLLILIFAETTPKTLAVLHPQQVAFPTSLALKILLRVPYPLVWLINIILLMVSCVFFSYKVAAHLPEPLTEPLSPRRVAKYCS